MDRPIGFWLKLVDQLIDERFDTTLDEHGVTRRQWQMLNLLSRGAADQAALDAAVAPFLERAAPPETAAHPAHQPAGPSAVSNPFASANGADASRAPGASTADSPAETLISELDELIESEWVVQNAGMLSLTPRGELSHAKIEELVETIRTAMSAEVVDGDLGATTRTLEKMARNLGWGGA